MAGRQAGYSLQGDGGRFLCGKGAQRAVVVRAGGIHYVKFVLVGGSCLQLSVIIVQIEPAVEAGKGVINAVIKVGQLLSGAVIKNEAAFIQPSG